MLVDVPEGDMFASPSEALVNPVNCVGVMGAGLARQFKKRFPDNFAAYREAHSNFDLRLGVMFLYDYGEDHQPRYIINFPTKDHWTDQSKMMDIKVGLKALRELIVEKNISSVSVPALGAGLGGLEWRFVRDNIEYSLGDLENVEILVYGPHRSRSHY